MSTFAITLTSICAVGAAMAAGTFFDFSTFAMRGLRRLPPAQGAAAMQSINREAPSPLFMAVLFGTGAAFAILGAYAVLNLDQSEAPLQLVASALYLGGVVVLTGTYHVPRNNKLESVDPESTAGAAYWTTYWREWVRMNHVRTLAPLTASVLLVAALANSG